MLLGRKPIIKRPMSRYNSFDWNVEVARGNAETFKTAGKLLLVP